MRLISLSGAALAALLASGVSAQETQIILYDAHGRVIGVSSARNSGNAATSSYSLDQADNRLGSTATVMTPPPTASLLEYPYTLVPTQKLTSANGQYTLTLEPSGDLVVRNSSGTALWNSCTSQGRSLYARVSSAGVLSIYDTTHAVIWSAGASGNPGAKLTMENSGSAVLRTAGGAVLWSSAVPCA